MTNPEDILILRQNQSNNSEQLLNQLENEIVKIKSELAKQEQLSYIQSIHPKSGDIIVFRTPGILSGPEVQKLQKMLSYYQGKFPEVSFVILPDGYKIEHISNEKMNKLGWYKKN